MVVLQGVEVCNGKVYKDNFYYIFEVLDNFCVKIDKFWLWWLVIFYDIVKLFIKCFYLQYGWIFYGYEVLGVSMVFCIFKKLCLLFDYKMKYVQKLVCLYLCFISLMKENIIDFVICCLLFEVGDDIDDFMQFCEADIIFKNLKKVKCYLENYEMVCECLQEVEEKDYFCNWQFFIFGEIIMEIFGIVFFWEVGIIKNVIWEVILDGDVSNNYDEVYQFMFNKGVELGLIVVN